MEEYDLIIDQVIQSEIYGFTAKITRLDDEKVWYKAIESGNIGTIDLYNGELLDWDLVDDIYLDDEFYQI